MCDNFFLKMCNCLYLCLHSASVFLVGIVHKQSPQLSNRFGDPAGWSIVISVPSNLEWIQDACMCRFLLNNCCINVDAANNIFVFFCIFMYSYCPLDKKQARLQIFQLSRYLLSTPALLTMFEKLR